MSFAKKAVVTVTELPDTQANGTLQSRPRVDWSQFTNSTIIKREPVTFLKHEDVEDAYEQFKKVSSKVARSQYDIPQGHCLIVAYSQTPFSSKPPKPVGVITFKAGDKSLQCPGKSGDYMDDYHHKVSFIFVERDYQREGIGRRLLQEAMNSMRKEDRFRPVRLEGANSAVKFFRKMGFISNGKPEVSVSRKGSSLFWKIYHMQNTV